VLFVFFDLALAISLGARLPPPSSSYWALAGNAMASTTAQLVLCAVGAFFAILAIGAVV
jgi:hypothetical protein